ncbi:hypothetical protein VNO77_02825 [Canavalia gladiata]|uniref:Uncharacterized protein n=1 Tax=Canavalia gladiata TaxID=3824 RepID=A0AAN9MTP0_CANGL
MESSVIRLVAYAHQNCPWETGPKALTEHETSPVKRCGQIIRRPGCKDWCLCQTRAESHMSSLMQSLRMFSRFRNLGSKLGDQPSEAGPKLVEIQLGALEAQPSTWPGGRCATYCSPETSLQIPPATIHFKVLESQHSKTKPNQILGLSYFSLGRASTNEPNHSISNEPSKPPLLCEH